MEGKVALVQTMHAWTGPSENPRLPTATSNPHWVVDRNAVANLDSNPLRIANTLRQWLDTAGREVASEMGLEQRELGAVIGWMRAGDGEANSNQGSSGSSFWRTLSSIADDWSDVFSRKDWRDHVISAGKDPSAGGQKGLSPMRNRDLCLLCLELPNNPDRREERGRGAVRSLRDALERLQTTECDADSQLLGFFRALEGVLKYLPLASSLLLPQLAYSFWNKVPKGHRAKTEKRVLSHSPLAKHDALGAFECLWHWLLHNRATLTPLKHLRSVFHPENRGRADDGVSLIAACFGQVGMWESLEATIKVRNRCLHHQTSSTRDTLAAKRARTELLGLFDDSLSFWHSFPLVATASEEHVTPMGSLVTFETELGDRITAPIHTVNGRPWRRGELVTNPLLIVARGQAEDWSFPLAVRYSKEILDPFCNPTHE